ncbi:DUF5684 domain-containing protein [Flavisolibacter tropicus]|uniref:Signal peptidase I n=1 Tax=Flavisolibacter tropicus TaxID=1492898 RepID=A0A172U026_9BACT|nr:DUF5684 domain-containing protein [Flavisolibacter tropicus]ANE52709.1 hypothetical protein SY85_21750 [Flavisolibacter tropicus]
MIFLLFLILFAFAFVIFLIASQWKVFEKAGQPGWACIVPIYNTYVLLKIAGKPGWWLLLLFVPFVNIVFAIWTVNMISKSFGKDEGFTAGLILLGFVFWPILGFGSAQYLGPYGDPEEFAARQNASRFDFEH